MERVRGETPRGPVETASSSSYASSFIVLRAFNIDQEQVFVSSSSLSFINIEPSHRRRNRKIVTALKFHYHPELFARICGGIYVYNHDEGILRGWNGLNPWIIIYTCTLVEVIKY